MTLAPLESDRLSKSQVSGFGLPGAIHLPYARLAGALEDGTLPRGEGDAAAGRPLLFFCAFGERSAMAVRAARAAGHVRSFHLEGGIDAWKRAGCATVACHD